MAFLISLRATNLKVYLRAAGLVSFSCIGNRLKQDLDADRQDQTEQVLVLQTIQNVEI